MVLPPTHGLTALIGALSLTAVVASHIRRRLDPATVGLGICLASGFRGAIGTWYQYAQITPGLRLRFVDRVLAAPGLFLAWVLALVLVTVWCTRLSTRAGTGLLGDALGGLFALLALNFLHQCSRGRPRRRRAYS